MARKIPADIQQMLFDRPMLVGVLRVASKKSDAEIERLFGEAWSSVSYSSFKLLTNSSKLSAINVTFE